MINSSCAFTGYRPSRFRFGYDESDQLCVKIKAELKRQTEILCKSGVRTFYFGGAEGVDLWAAEAVLELRPQYPGIELVCVLPFSGHDRLWRMASRRRLQEILRFCPPPVVIGKSGDKHAYQERNRYMVDHAQSLIAVIDLDSPAQRSGTLQTLNYAKKKERRIIVIHPNTVNVTRIPG